ncbi:MAG: hypothetical protein E7172_03155 [Firmicutes bacterium]|nr:hypothetical protein [Bacillota bacterium]
MNDFQKLIAEICNECGYEYNLVSNNWINMITYQNKTKIIAGHKFDLNTVGITQVLDDKFALYDVLKHFNIPIINHHLIYKDTEWSDVLDLYNKYNQKLVVKVNNGSCGRGVYYVNNESELKESCEEIFLHRNSLSITPYLDIKREYRIIVLDKEIKLIYGKIKPIVIGDGIKTIKELLLEFNEPFFKNVDVEDKVLAKDEEYVYNWQFNLSKGAVSTLEVDEKTKEKLLEIVDKILNKIDIRFCSIDIIEVNKEFQVLEMNSGVMMDNFMHQHPNSRNIAKNIYKEAIQKMFE